MGRPSKWDGQPTVAIRVPSHLADALLEMARLLATPKAEQPPLEERVSYVSPPRLFTVDEKSYLLPPLSLSESEVSLIDGLIDEFCTELDGKDLPLLVAKLAPLILSELT